ncbi:hypothetical protein IGI96_001744 [Enterococcus sp. DIV0421]|uniref:TcpD family membrane protein n=1 Tax=Enterococcus sp. DIV0421 TaxID=2774688 RepID=UPI003F230600
MTLREFVNKLLSEAGYFVIMGVVYLALRGFMKSKIGSVLIAVGVGAVIYFFLNDPSRVLNAIGEWIAKIFVE